MIGGQKGRCNGNAPEMGFMTSGAKPNNLGPK